jgi:hypothetical protein
MRRKATASNICILLGKLYQVISCPIEKTYAMDHVGICRNPLAMWHDVEPKYSAFAVRNICWPNGGRQHPVLMPKHCTNWPLVLVWLALAEARADHPVLLPVCDRPHNLPTCGMDRTFIQALAPTQMS